MKNFLDILIGFPIIGLFTGFWESIQRLDIDWNLVIGTVLIQIFVVVFRSAFESWWKKFGKRWLGLSILILFGCSSPGTVQKATTLQDIPVPPVNVLISGGSKSQIDMNWEIHIDTTRRTDGTLSVIETRKSSPRARFDSSLVLTHPDGTPAGKLDVIVQFDASRRNPFGVNLHFYDQIIPKGTPVITQVEPVYKDPAFHPPSFTLGTGFGFLLGVGVVYLIIKRIRYETK